MRCTVYKYFGANWHVLADGTWHLEIERERESAGCIQQRASRSLLLSLSLAHALTQPPRREETPEEKTSHGTGICEQISKRTYSIFTLNRKRREAQREKLSNSNASGRTDRRAVGRLADAVRARTMRSCSVSKAPWLAATLLSCF